jgi:hypothetical protein
MTEWFGHTRRGDATTQPASAGPYEILAESGPAGALTRPTWDAPAQTASARQGVEFGPGRG